MLLLLLFIFIPVLTVGTCHIQVIRELYENLKPESKNIQENNFVFCCCFFLFELLPKLIKSILKEIPQTPAECSRHPNYLVHQKPKYKINTLKKTSNILLHRTEK